MLNILSYVGMSLQAEVCLWTLLGLLRTIFDATLFKVNANLKQVWHMTMPSELSLPVQRVLRTMVSGVMLVQCFTLYVYLASYIVLLYPVFLEERPTLVLPWLLLAAVRRLLCELTSLALGLGTCVLLGPARPPCIRFLITKVISITPALYMWLLVLRYAERPPSITKAHSPTRLKFDEKVHAVSSKDSVVESKNESDTLRPLSVTSNRTISDTGIFEDCLCSEAVTPRDTDRILEQFVVMSLRIVAYLKKEGTDSSKFFDSLSPVTENKPMGLEGNALSSENSEPPPIIGSSKGKMASYLTDYPQIFMKKASDIIHNSKSDSMDVMDKDTENKAVGPNSTFSHTVDRDWETITFTETKENYGKSNDLSSINSKNSNEKSSYAKNKLQDNKREVNITITPESYESFEYPINEVENHLATNSVPKLENTSDINIEGTIDTQSTVKAPSNTANK